MRSEVKKKVPQFGFNDFAATKLAEVCLSANAGHWSAGSNHFHEYYHYNGIITVPRKRLVQILLFFFFFLYLWSSGAVCAPLFLRVCRGCGFVPPAPLTPDLASMMMLRGEMSLDCDKSRQKGEMKKMEKGK